jgi:hypothetical protein
MLPAQYTRVKSAINERFEKNVKDYLERIKGEQKATEREITLLTERTLDWMTTGIVDLSQRGDYIGVHLHGMGWGSRGFVWSQYFRQMCKDLRRPYVWIARSYSYNEGIHTTTLEVPNRRYCDPLIASFRLLVETGTAPVEKAFSAKHSIIRFNFFREEGAQLVDAWREQCRVDPVMRKALRLPGA